MPPATPLQGATIRPERDGDAQDINDLTRDAFAPMAFSDGNEQDMTAKLQQDGDLALSLVVVMADRIIGHVAFSPVTIAQSNGAWYALGPISIASEYQRQGLGTWLAKTGLSELAATGAAGCVLTGNPDVYRPMGFTNDHSLTHDGLDSTFILYQSIDGSIPSGEVTFAPALQEDQP